MERFVLRDALPGDMAELAAVFRAASLSNAGDRALLLAHPEALELPAELVRAGNTRVAVTGGEVVGFASAVARCDALELEDLFVRPDRMRRGIGLALIRDVVSSARAGGMRRVTVTANPHALAFYERAGFVQIGTAQTDFYPAPRMELLVD